MNKIKSGDEVIVRSGQHKGRRGVVQKVILDSNGKPARVLVEGVNLVTHYDRPNPQQNQQGGLIKREAPIHASNVGLVDPDTGKASRVKFKDKKRMLASGKEVA